ncbi:MAG: endonuclease/exonuclease/phosphatase family protein [Candidatus Nanopelagicales bacterium]
MRIVSWNLWGRIGPWRERAEPIAHTLRELSPDLIGLQEVWVAEGTSSAHQIAAALGYEHVVLSNPTQPEPGDSENSNAIISRYPIAEHHTMALPHAPTHRWVTLALIDHPAGQFPFLTTHLDWRAEEGFKRLAQVRAITSFMRAHQLPERHDEFAYPTVICGDFNAPPESDEIRLLTGTASALDPDVVLMDAWVIANHPDPGYSWSRSNPHTVTDPGPSRRLDYVFLDWPAHPTRGWVQAAALAGREPVAGMVPSDHYAVVVDISD